jgi:hypothetical protein
VKLEIRKPEFSTNFPRIRNPKIRKLVSSQKDQTYNREVPCMPSDANAMGTKPNVVLYHDREIVGRLNLKARAIRNRRG